MTDYLTTEEVYTLLKLKKPLLSHFISMGLINPNRIGISIVWTPEDVASLRIIIKEIAARKAKKKEDNLQRALGLAERYKEGETLEMIAITEGVTRERVRQLLAKVNVRGPDGGSAARRARRKEITDANAAARKERKCMEFYGCDLATYFLLTGYGKFSKGKGRYQSKDLAPAYYSHKWAAKRRGVGWEITLPQYAEFVMPEIQKIDRGAFSLTRIDKKGPFAIGNVEIITASEHAKRIKGFVQANNRRKERAEKRRGEAKRLFDEGKTRHEIAQMMRVSTASVSSWIARERAA